LLLRAYLRPRWSPLLPYTTLFRSSPRYQIHKTAGRRGTVRRAGTGGRCSKVLAEYNPRAPMAAPNLSADTPWLYRQGDLVLGPVDAASITRLLEEGSLTATSEIAPLGSSEFHPVGEVEPFVVIAAKAATRQRLLAAEAQADQ